MAATDILNDLFSLDGKVALVTGGSAGIGLGIAEVLGGAGAKVVISGRNLDNARDAAAGLREKGLDVRAVRLDPAVERSVIGACREVIAAHGVPWILVNNAGKQDGELLLEGTAEHWDETYATNLRGPFLLTREIGKAMVEAGEGGRIVNVGSRVVLGRMMAGLGAYVSSKSGMLGLSMASATELVDHGITVNTLLPGGVVTPGGMTATRPPVDPEKMPPRPPMGLSDPKDIGAAVLFFASPAAHRITNQVVSLDAGFSVVL